jgi:hypothetical protein
MQIKKELVVVAVVKYIIRYCCGGGEKPLFLLL